MATNYRIGQIVEVTDPWGHVLKGDLGTVVSKPYRFIDGAPWMVDVLPHRLDGRFCVPIPNIRLYDNPMDRPNRSAGAGQTIRALSTVINQTLPHALEEVTRDLERARMEKEDLRTKSFVPTTDWDRFGRIVTWRELAKNIRRRLTDRSDRMDMACEIARAALESQPSMRTVRRTFTEIHELLDSDYEQPTESDNEEVSEED